MWINTYVCLLASFAAISTATFAGFPYTPSISSYSADLLSPYDYSASHLFADPYAYYPGYLPNHISVYPSYSQSLHFKPQTHHSEQFRGFAYHNDFKGGSTSNVLFLTGLGASHIGGIPTFYPGFDSPAVEIARKKASNAVDKNAAGKKIDTVVKTKDLCDTFPGLFDKNGVHNFYSLDNGPLVIRNGFDFNVLPTLPQWPYGFDGFGPVYKDGIDITKVKTPKDQSKKVDDDTVAIERKITLKVPGSTTLGIINPAAPDTTESGIQGASDTPIENPANDNDDETRTISALPPSTEEPASSSSATGQADDADSSTVDNSKRKRQSLRIRKVKSA